MILLLPLRKKSPNLQIEAADTGIHIKNDDFVSFDEATKDADLILILCDHNEFKNPNYNLISKNMKNPIIFDTKNIISKVPNGIKLYNYGNLYKLN